jgi:hypothetical protein
MKLILLALLIIQVSPPPTNRGEQKKPTDKEQQTANPQPSKSVYIFNNQDAATEHKKEAPDKSKQGPDKPPWWDIVWATWALVVIGGLGVGAALVTLGILRKQTNAIQQTLNIERPWLLITFADNWVEQFDKTKPQDKTTTAIWKFKNFGRTPAFILYIGCTLEIVPDPNKLPPQPVYGKPYKFTDEMMAIAPNQESGGIGAAVDHPDTPESSEFYKCVNGELRLVLYGCVRYASSFNSKNILETRFCYEYVFAGPRESGFSKLSGPPLVQPKFVKTKSHLSRIAK